MSSSESSGAPAEATATTPAPEAAFPSFGTTRGSGLARGKRPAAAPAATAAASSDYKPTAIEVVSAPREYQNPFAPVETPAAVTAPEPVAVPAPQPVVAAPVAPVVVAPVGAPDSYVAPAATAPAPAPVAPAPVVAAKPEAPASLNILEPLQPKTVPAQTWESEGFRPTRESRPERAPRREEPRRDEPRREERSEEAAPQQPAEPFDASSIPEKFLYVRPGYNYVPTPSNYGGAPRDRAPRGEVAPAASSAPAARSGEAPKSSHRPAPVSQPAASGGGFFGWLKGLFGGAPETPAAPQAQTGEHRASGDRPHGQHRGGGNRSRGGQGQSQSQGGGYQGGGDGQRRRSRGGRGRSGGGQHRGGGEGSQQGGV